MKIGKPLLFIAAGGKGSRLGNLIAEIPKPLVSVCGKPILDHIIGSSINAGITGIAICVKHMKQKIINHIPKQYIIIENKSDSLFPPLVKLAKERDADYIVGVNGDTLIHPDSLIYLNNLMVQSAGADAAVLMTKITRTSPQAKWSYWKHVFSGSRLVSMNDSPGNQIDSEFLAAAFRRSSVERISDGFTNFFQTPETFPFKNYDFGWNHILKTFSWKNYNIVGKIGDDLCININRYQDIEEATLLFQQPALFRFRRLIPEGAKEPVISEKSLITIFPQTTKSNVKILREKADKMKLKLSRLIKFTFTKEQARAWFMKKPVNINMLVGKDSLIAVLEGVGAFYKCQQISTLINSYNGNMVSDTINVKNSFENEFNRLTNILSGNSKELQEALITRISNI